MCRANTVPLPGGVKPLEVWFTCQGPLYDDFMQQLLAQHYDQNNNATTWGRRSAPLPPNSRTLLLGNGHMRQLGQVLACQQAAAGMPVTAVQRLDKYATELQFDSNGYNATFVLVTNTYASFAENRTLWQSLLQAQLQRPLTDFTSIVLGLVDECIRSSNDPTARVNAFTTTMTQFNLSGVDCMQYDPPSLQDWYLATSTTPVVFVSPLTTARRSATRRAFHTWRRTAAAQVQQQRLLGFIHARQYVTQNDCMSAGRAEMGDCLDKASTGNPCQGAAGGWADLVVWDVTEFLWKAAAAVASADTTTPFTNLPDAALPPTQPWQSLPTIVDDVTFCRSPLLQSPIDVFSDQSDIHYQCAGPLYDALIADLHPFARDQTYRRLPAEHWGKRQFGLVADKRILFYGNSHTRQVAKALACQQMELKHLETVVSINTTRVHQFDMRNNATMVVVTNTFAPYSHEWVKLTEEDMGMSLQSFDALVVGAFNNCEGDNAFSREMVRYSQEMENVDCINIPPPTLIQIAQHFAGPIIYVTMFVKSANEQDHDLTRQEIQQLRTVHNRTNVHFVEARKYIDATHDCRGQERFNVSDCYPQEGSGGPTHECTGPQGGHADLIAWDVIEHLYRELGNNSDGSKTTR